MNEDNHVRDWSKNHKPVDADQVDYLIAVLSDVTTKLDDLFWEVRRVNDTLDAVYPEQE